MLQEEARVTRVEPGAVWVETCRQSACQSCSARKGCGHSLLSKSAGRVQQLRVVTPLELKPGDQVILGLDEASLLKGSALLYLLPLVLMLVMALSGEMLFGKNSIVSLLCAGFGLLVGFATVRFYMRSSSGVSGRYHPVILKQIPSPSRDPELIYSQ